MKNSFEMPDVPEGSGRVVDHDKTEIDNPDKHHPGRLYYLDRLNTVIALVRGLYPSPGNVTVGEFGCAQGNLSLRLAELGYKTWAVDRNPAFIEYSKLKRERGDVKWVVGEINDPALRGKIGALDVAILGEVIEHCAYPEEVISNVLKYVRPNGILVVTTPNGSRLMTPLPTFKEVRERGERKTFEKRQFGPDAEDHLFLFKLGEIRQILPAGARIVEEGYLGGTILVNRYTLPLLRLMPAGLVERATRMLSKIPLINSKTFNNIYAVVSSA